VERVGKWVNLVTFALVVVGVSCRRSRAVLWAGIPIVLLSMLPHKEARYMLPVLAFLSMLAGEGAWRLIEWVRQRERQRLATIASLALGLFWLHSNLRSYPSPRSEDSVRAAILIGEQHPNGTVAFEWGTGSGGGIYMSAWQHRDLLPPLHDAPLAEIEGLIRREDLTCIALRARTLNRIGVESALQELGWSELTRGSNRDVRVFVRDR
jgi:hypothetical protein